MKISNKELAQKQVESILSSREFSKNPCHSEICRILEKYRSSKDILYADKGQIAVIGNYNGTIPGTDWILGSYNISVRNSTLDVISKGGMFTKSLDYYFMEEHCHGGKTFQDRGKKLEKILSMAQRDTNIFELEVQNGLGEKLSLYVQDESEVKKRIDEEAEKAIEKNRRSWLSYENLNPVVLPSNEPNGSIETNYPYDIQYNTIENTTYVAVTKVIGAASHQKGCLDKKNGHKDFLINPQFNVSYYMKKYLDKNGRFKKICENEKRFKPSDNCMLTLFKGKSESSFGISPEFRVSNSRIIYSNMELFFGRNNGMSKGDINLSLHGLKEWEK
ncbi:hypothetical protein J4226_03425 [Candidatus Pacearchaeota archaeon]|nr:hypothetical protein [Candidatus Pacearchaeota archaeon]